jgi:Dyp-type peroxidase family
MTQMTSARLIVSPGDIQQHIVRSARPQVAAYAFFIITEPQRFRAFLRSRGSNAPTGVPAAAALAPAATLLDALAARDMRILPERPAGKPQAGFTLAFTWTGLRALQVHPVTLETFPAVFKEGMAARAHLLGDFEDSAPNRWDGWLGHRDVHGLIGILVSASEAGASATAHGVPSLYTKTVALAKKLAQSGGEPGGESVAEIAALEASAGFRIVQLEVGYTPLRHFQGESYRVEHFGFRDGLSQPFVDLGLTPPPPGGGTPRRDGTWAPVAPGEIFLGPPDEDGLIAIQPANPALRTNGTYMVFRKLAQDVVGFHHYVDERARDTEHGQRLAAQMFGRWQNGAPLTRHPRQPKWYGASERNQINDFRFHTEDPHGLKCPVASHVRRVNPRDQQLRDVAKRHRILRQSIPYGGDLIERPDDWDGEERGLLFICYQARIDAQFEFIQREWINGGEIFGQAGLDKCPITGANNGALTDAFQVPGSPAALTHIPRFVSTRGGDYFFVPSMEALKGIAEGRTFEPQHEHGYVQAPKPSPAGDVTMGVDDAITRTSIDVNRPHMTPSPAVPETPSLFSERRLALLSLQLLQGEARVVRFRFGAQRDTQSPAQPAYAAFVGRYDDVVSVLTSEAAFTVRHYREHIEEITHGKSMVIGLAANDPVRAQRLKLLLAAFAALADGGKRDIYAELEGAAAEITRSILARLLPAGRMDVVRDLGLVVPVVIAKHFFGLPGPERVSPTAIAASFARLELTDAPPDWLAGIPPVLDHEKPVITVQAWAQAAFREVFLNIVRARELTISTQRMTDEMLLHIDELMEHEYRKPSGQHHLLAALVGLKRGQDVPADIDEHIRAILAELLVGGIYTVGKALANIVYLILGPQRIEPRMAGIFGEGGAPRPGLMTVLREACATADAGERKRKLDAFISECLRFRPVSPVLFRICAADAPVGGQRIAAGDLVCTLVQAANMDPRKFSAPREFRLDREPNTYLHFGPMAGPHRCLGEHIALAELRSMLMAIAQLKDFRRAAGPRGDLEELLRLPQSLTVRFTPEAQPRVTQPARGQPAARRSPFPQISGRSSPCCRHTHPARGMRQSAIRG